MSFKFVDLFAGIGGFHAVASSFGGECVYAVESNEDAASIYELNWGIDPRGDITADANENTVNIPDHDVLFAGFPCQPFSKSGHQLGMNETRGTLYWNILRIIQERKPSMVFLENVKNIAGPRHLHEWNVIIATLRSEGYRVSNIPTVFSPHLLPYEMGGRPQIRERVFICATLGDSGSADPVVENKPVDGWDPKSWDIFDYLDEFAPSSYYLPANDAYMIEAWNDFAVNMKHIVGYVPRFPIWAHCWNPEFSFPDEAPHWKQKIIKKNMELYSNHSAFLYFWTQVWDVFDFPASRQKLEWQAQDTDDLWSTVMQLRPSGIRAKAPTYLPALVAITQTSIVGALRRKIMPVEAARLQGLPDSFDFGSQSDRETYRQLGNGISIGAASHVFKEHVRRDIDIVAKNISDSVLD